MLEQFKEQVKELVDLRDVFARYGIQMKRVTGEASSCCCPVHEEKTPSCHVHQSYFYCFGCQASGDVLSFIMDRENVDFMQALKMAAETVNLQLPDRTQYTPEQAAAIEAKRTKLDLMRLVLDTCQAFYRDCLENQPVGADALAYCRRRHWGKDLRELFGVGFAPDDQVLIDKVRAAVPPGTPVTDLLLATGMMGQKDDGSFQWLRFRQRVMFPVHDARGRLCGFSGRWLEPAAPADPDAAPPKRPPAKYLNTPATELFDKGNLLYGLHVASRAMGKTGKAVVVEGQPDVIACHAAGIAVAVAPLGTALTTGHLDQLKKQTGDGTACLLLDGDKAGQAAIKKSVLRYLEN